MARARVDARDTPGTWVQGSEVADLGAPGSGPQAELFFMEHGSNDPRRRFYDRLPVNDRELEVSEGVSRDG
jgi:hypothetical protein